ncbi:hypothetical protein G9A89_021655 [Geosiphon pyriformis]|nr:hypothetical protein G9A89_021655 [Geosiphon pyriformis]
MQSVQKTTSSPMEIDGISERSKEEEQEPQDEMEEDLIPDLKPVAKLVQNMPESPKSPSTHQKANFSRDVPYPDLLRMYYQQFFPYKSYYHWLNYETVPTKAFLNREFSFTLDKVFVRYQSFKDGEELKKELLNELPTKFDIGAIYTAQPKHKKNIRANQFQAIMKELVFDIDMTDYDDIRICCSGANICRKCWKFMTIAIKIIDVALRDDFGFKHILWVYSGRRGVHCWVCDERALKLDNEGRRALIAYLEVVKGGAQQDKKVILPKSLHPALQRSYEIIDSHFTSMALDDQDILGTQERRSKFLKSITDPGIRKELQDKWTKTPSGSSRVKWEDVISVLKQPVSFDGKMSKEKEKAREEALEGLKREIMFQYIYPRLDSNVTMTIHHLLKSPFCIHPDTGRVCVPFSADECENFSPFNVPTLAQLFEEINCNIKPLPNREKRLNGE